MEYDDGLVIWVNGSKEETWKTPQADLPPSGYYAKSPNGDLEVFSALKNGKRGDYVISPAYDFIDGRGTWLETPFGATDKQLIILKKEDGARELIPYGTEKFAIALERAPKTMVALDGEGNEIGPATGDLQNGLYHVAMPTASKPDVGTFLPVFSLNFDGKS